MGTKKERSEKKQISGFSKIFWDFWISFESLLIKNDLLKRKKITKKQYLRRLGRKCSFCYTNLVDIMVTKNFFKELKKMLWCKMNRYSKSWVNGCEKSKTKRNLAKNMCIQCRHGNRVTHFGR